MTDTHPALALHDAFVRGDIAEIRRLCGGPQGFPNVSRPGVANATVLEYAIYWSPFAAIKQLLQMGADPNYGDHAGFPSLIAALSTQRPEKLAIVELLLAFGADLAQRGVNDWTPLHWAAAANDLPGVELLLRHGADPQVRSRIDDLETPLECAERGGFTELARLLRGPDAKAAE